MNYFTWLNQPTRNKNGYEPVQCAEILTEDFQTLTDQTASKTEPIKNGSQLPETLNPEDRGGVRTLTLLLTELYASKTVRRMVEVVIRPLVAALISLGFNNL